MASNKKQFQKVWNEKAQNKQPLTAGQIDVDSIRALFDRLGLRYGTSTGHEVRHDKLHQVVDYLVQIVAAVRKMSTKRTIVLMDCGCGNSYLSFAANYYLTEVLKRDVRFICVDVRADLIEKSRRIAEKFGYGTMEFHQSSIADFVPDQRVDIVYSLHACDVATDQTIAQGVKAEAHYIMTVACCQRTIRKQMCRTGLTAKSKDCKERLGDMIADAMRSKLLTAHGYKTSLFEYSAARHSPKNMMLRAEFVRCSATRRQQAREEYQQLLNSFCARAALEDYLPVFPN